MQDLISKHYLFIYLFQKKFLKVVKGEELFVCCRERRKKFGNCLQKSTFNAFSAKVIDLKG